MGEAFRDGVIQKKARIIVEGKNLAPLNSHLDFPSPPPTPGLNIAMHDGARAPEKEKKRLCDRLPNQ